MHNTQRPTDLHTHAHAHSNGCDLTVFGALPKVDLDAVRQNCEAAKAKVDDSDLVLTKLIADTEALAERCEKLQNILAMLVSATAGN